MLASSYVCPHCNTKTVSVFHYVLKETEAARLLSASYGASISNQFYSTSELTITTCLDCGQPVLWVNSKMVWPIPKGLPAANEMPKRAKKFFEEAQSVLYLSPRSACALLRICLEELVNTVAMKRNPTNFNPKKSLISRIESLGVSDDILSILTACRMAGNANVHPGVLDLSEKDTTEMAKNMSQLLNTLVEIWIKPEIQAKELLSRMGKS